MPLFSRQREPQLAPALDDDQLARVVKAVQVVPRPGAIGSTDLHMGQISQLLQRTGMNWDRRSHRLLVLAQVTADTAVPSAWIGREPDSADALLLHAWASLVRGRRTGELGDVNSIVTSCYRAAELFPEDPTPWVIVLGISRLQRFAHEVVMSIWGEVMARDRWHREAHLQMLGYLSPNECGSRVQVLDFVDSMRLYMPPNAPTAAVELTAAVDQFESIRARGGAEALMARDFWKHKPVAGALDRAAERWPQPGFLQHASALADLNLLAYALLAAERRDHASRVFAVLDGRVTNWPWQLMGDPVTVFSHHAARSRR